MKIRLILLCSLFLFSYSGLKAQKVKYKKGKVSVDKVHKFNFEKIEKEDRSLDSYVLKDLEGNELFSLRDTLFYFDQLPNEKSPRVAYEAYICNAPNEDLTALIPYNPVMGYAKQRIKNLSKVGFFKETMFTKDMFKEFVMKQYPKAIAENLERITDLNKTRLENYNLSKEAFGDLMERDPRNPSVVINVDKTGNYLIKEGNTVLAKVNVDNKGSNNHSYKVFNHESAEIGAINIFQKPTTQSGVQKIRYNVKMHALGEGNSEELYKWFYEKVSTTGSSSSTSKKLRKISKYLVENGFL